MSSFIIGYAFVLGRNFLLAPQELIFCCAGGSRVFAVMPFL